jgi:hypothetical protein
MMISTFRLYFIYFHYLLFWATWPPQVRTDGRTVGRSRDRTDGRTGHVFGRTPHVFGRTPPLTEGVPWGVGCFFAPTPPQNPPSPMACSRPDGRVGRTVWTDGFLDGRFGRTVWTDGLLDGRFGRRASWTDGLLDGRFGRTVWTDSLLDGQFGRTVWTDGLLDGQFGRTVWMDGLDGRPLGRTVWEGFIFGWLCQVCGWMGGSDVQAWPEALSQARPGPERARPCQAMAEGLA